MRFMVSLSNHEAPHPTPCEAFMVRQAHHEGHWNAAEATSADTVLAWRPVP
jgi:hypothetical protein